MFKCFYHFGVSGQLKKKLEFPSASSVLAMPHNSTMNFRMNFFCRKTSNHSLVEKNKKNISTSIEGKISHIYEFTHFIFGGRTFTCPNTFVIPIVQIPISSADLSGQWNSVVHLSRTLAFEVSKLYTLRISRVDRHPTNDSSSASLMKHRDRNAEHIDARNIL